MHGKTVSLQHGIPQLESGSVGDELRSLLQPAYRDGEIVARTGDSTDFIKFKRGWHASGFRSKVDFRERCGYALGKAAEHNNMKHVNKCLGRKRLDERWICGHFAIDGRTTKCRVPHVVPEAPSLDRLELRILFLGMLARERSVSSPSKAITSSCPVFGFLLKLREVSGKLANFQKFN